MKKIYRAFLALLPSVIQANITYTLLRGPEILCHAPAITRLYLESWQEYPDLCEASFDEYEPYVRAYGESNSGIACIAHDGSVIIGATTALPLLEKSELFSTPMQHSGFDLSRILYLGEVVVNRLYRSQGVGSMLFEMMCNEVEAHCKYTHCLIYTVEPAAGEEIYAPEQHKPIQLFWGKRGFVPLYERRFTASWQSIVSHTLTFHTMTPCIKRLNFH